MQYIVNVGNIGNIECKDRQEAEKVFSEYVEQSKSGYGRAAGEPVCLFAGGEIERDYFPPGPNDEEPLTDVVFRKYPKEKETDRLEVIAFFPGISEGNSRIMSYQHVGQHGAADPSLIHTLGRCTYSEYEPLLKELTEQVGYNLNVLSDREAAKLFA